MCLFCFFLPPFYCPPIYRKILHGIPFKLNRIFDAIGYFNTAIELDPTYEIAYSNRAEVKLKFGSFKEAIEDCDKAIEINSESWAHYFRGLAKIGLGQDGCDDLKKSLEVSDEEEEKKKSEEKLAEHCEL